MEYTHKRIFQCTEFSAERIRDWLYRLYIQELIKQSKKLTNSLFFKLKKTLGFKREIIFETQIKKIIEYENIFTGVKDRIAADIYANHFGNGYAYVYAQDNIEKVVKYKKPFSGLFYGTVFEKAEEGYVGNIYINFTIKKDIENYLHYCNEVELLYLIQCKMHYLMLVLRHEFNHAIQAIGGTYRQDGGIVCLPENSPKDLMDYFHPKTTNKLKKVKDKYEIKLLKIYSKYRKLKEAEKPYEFYPYVLDAVDAFKFYKKIIPDVLHEDFAKLWVHRINEKDFEKYLSDDVEKKYLHCKPLIYIFWKFLNNTPYYEKALKQFLKRVDYGN